MQAGSELGRFAVSEVKDDVGFAFEVAFNERGILEGMPCFLFLRVLLNEIFRIITDLTPFL